jgi:hypothetical protein
LWQSHRSGIFAVWVGEGRMVAPPNYISETR